VQVRCLIVASLLAVAWPSVGIAQTVPASESDAARDQRLSMLIRQLGARDFTLRQTATREIVRIGPAALPELKRTLASPDVEVRNRSAWIMEQIRAESHEDLLEQLLARPGAPAPAGLPGWRHYIAITTDTSVARRLYAAMLRAEPDVLAALAPEDAAAFDVERRLQARLESISGRIRIGQGEFTFDVSRETLGALLLLASAAESEADDNRGPNANLPERQSLATLLPMLVEHGRLLSGVLDDPAQEPFRDLMRGWVRSPIGGPPAERLRIGIQFEFPDAVEPALELISGIGATTEERQRALLVIARFGNPDHVSAVESLLADEEPLLVYGRSSERDTPRMQDLALLTLVHLTGQNPQQYGFDELRPDAATLYEARSVSFVDREARRRAFRQWDTWRAVDLHGRYYGAGNAAEGVGL
jgi:hypothetical protein